MSLYKHAQHEMHLLGWLDNEDEMQKLVCEDTLECIEKLEEQAHHEGTKTQSELCSDILSLIKIFDSHGHSGSSAPYAIALFTQLAKYGTLSPLTGNDDEWAEIGDNTFQNCRASDVFKYGKDGRAYWLYARTFVDKSNNDVTFTNSDSRKFIDFPWTRPKTQYIDVVVNEDGDSIIVDPVIRKEIEIQRLEFDRADS